MKEVSGQHQPQTLSQHTPAQSGALHYLRLQKDTQQKLEDESKREKLLEDWQTCCHLTQQAGRAASLSDHDADHDHDRPLRPNAAEEVLAHHSDSESAAAARPEHCSELQNDPCLSHTAPPATHSLSRAAFREPTTQAPSTSSHCTTSTSIRLVTVSVASHWQPAAERPGPDLRVLSDRDGLRVRLDQAAARLAGGLVDVTGITTISNSTVTTRAPVGTLPAAAARAVPDGR
eukprot:214624-Rhodomonas_salina.1